MKRRFWIALLTGTTISGAAAIGVEAPTTPLAQPLTQAQRAVRLETARQAQRDMIEARYQAERAQCDSLGGARRDRCLIDAHARKGLLMMETAAPYQL